jgi:leucyl aminopeptidase
MEFAIKTGSALTQRTPALVLGVFAGRKLSAAAAAADEASGGGITRILRKGDFAGEPGQTQWLYGLKDLPAERVLLVGCGPERRFDGRAYVRANATAARALERSGATSAVSALTQLEVGDADAGWRIRQAVIASADALYRFDEFKSKPSVNKRPLRRLALTVESRRELKRAEAGLEEGRAVAAGMGLCKDLGNRPGNSCTPTHLGEQAQGLARRYRRIKTQVIDQRQLEKLGMGAFVSVAKGSKEPGKLIIMQYGGGRKSQKPVVLVGKGITFDTGGISIKPAAAMDEMKWDMGGAASVFGALTACAELGLNINVVGVVAAAENMPDGNASKPGDIVTTLSGQTVEILNTDAEGRLVLCDALTYVARYEPDVVIDMATLTGACIVALGHEASGLLGNHEALTQDLLEAGRASLDRAWELPLWEEYGESLKSNFADMANIGGRSAGAITAGAFLSRFTEDYRWAHLDIAGTAWHGGERKGSSGRPVPLLVEYLCKRAGRRR